jgi:hypothetical protein
MLSWKSWLNFNPVDDFNLLNHVTCYLIAVHFLSYLPLYGNIYQKTFLNKFSYENSHTSILFLSRNFSLIIF